MSETTFVIEVLDGTDIVALARCMALDASVFPHASIPLVPGGGPARVWVACSEPRAPVIGFAATTRRAQHVEIVGLAVDPKQRRSGVGRALLREVVAGAFARSAVAVTLHVSTTNEAAIALYESEGFHARRLLRRYYSAERFGDGGNAFEMILRLRPTLWR